MKRALSVVLMLSMAIGLLCFPAVTMAAPQFTVPSDWQLIVGEDFGNEADGTLAEEDTLLTQFITNHT